MINWCVSGCSNIQSLSPGLVWSRSQRAGMLTCKNLSRSFGTRYSRNFDILDVSRIVDLLGKIFTPFLFSIGKCNVLLTACQVLFTIIMKIIVGRPEWT